MEAGLTVYSTSGALQIDSTYKNLSLAQKLTLTINQQISGAPPLHRYTVITPPPGYPLIAWSSDFYIFGEYLEDGRFAFGANLEDMGKTFTAYVFTTPDLAGPATRGAGLWVYNAQGALVFDSTLKWARVTASVPAGTAEAAGQSNAFPARTYAVTTAQITGKGRWDGPLGGADPQGNATFFFTTAVKGARSLPTGAAWGPVYGEKGSQVKANVIPMPQGYDSGPGEVLLLDVTGY